MTIGTEFFFLDNPFSDISKVIVYSSYSLLRMILGLIASYAFAIIFGVVAARNKRAEKIMMPVLDVLQSVPILGFFPAAIFFFIALFQGSWVGIQLAAVFLIFTSQAWNLAYAVYESVSSIPADLEEASGSFGLQGWKRFKTLYIPTSVPKLVYNGILSWSTGWYYLVAAEMISIGAKQYTLHGIGSYLAMATYAGNYQGTILGLSTLVIMILVVDLVLWRPLRSYANRFRYETVATDEKMHRVFIHDPRFVWLRSHLPLSLPQRPAALSQVIPTRTFKPIVAGMRYAAEEHGFVQRHRKAITIGIIISAVIIFFIPVESFFSGLLSFPAAVSSDLQKSEVSSMVDQIPSALGYSLLRLLAAYLLSIAWILPLALKLAGRPRSFGSSIFTMEVLASLPATALFPLIILGTINLPGGLQLTSIILTMTGMQWYLLFNVLGGVRSIPSDLNETAKTYGITGIHKMKKFILPAILPSFITGSITAWGGGWNALILSEYITFKKETLSVSGIGALMNKAAYDIGSVALLTIILVVMVCVVVVLNRFVWKRLYKITFSKYRLDY